VSEHNHNTPPTSLHLQRVRRAVARLAEGGFRVLRVHPNDKRPVDAGWPEKATDDERVLDDWFSTPFNVGVACGPQPNGINLVVIDVDTRDDGMSNWIKICAEHPDFTTATHFTPSGGLHVFFDAPVPLSNSKLAPGIDVRGFGGQVVVPPSIGANGTEYAQTNPGSALGQGKVSPMPSWLVKMQVKPVVERSVERHPSQPSTNGQGLQTADWFREHSGWDWIAVLEAQGYDVVRQHGDEVFLRHPTATSEWSCVVHLDSNHMYAYSTNMPNYLREAQIGRDGGTSWTPYDWWTRTTYDGDYSAAASEVNRRRMAGATARATAVAPAGEDATSLNLPSTFWEARPVLTQIRQAAWAAGCSPDALLVQTLARVATYVHPSFKLPGVQQGLIGKHQTLDFLGCVVAETSGGKTLAAGVAEDFVPAPDPPGDGSDPMLDFEQKVGSGEGIAEFFLVVEKVQDSEGNWVKTGKRVIGKQALFMNVDEGTGFTQQAGRKGTTIIATLASAWSGESLGQLNAAEETRRLVRGGRVRICAVINMQDTNGYKLYSDELESVGFTGRLMFASAHDPEAPEPGDEPAWPGPIVWDIRAGSATGTTYFTYAPEITNEIKNTRWGILTKRVQIDRRQSQYLLLRCKVAALLAVLDDRQHVTISDWLLATQAITMSSNVLTHLDSVHSAQGEVTAVTAAAFKLKVGEKASSLHVRQLQVTWQAKLLERLSKRGPLPWKGLKDIVESARRTELRQALEAMVDEGVIVLDGSTYRKP
jgi:hypothetical protein